MLRSTGFVTNVLLTERTLNAASVSLSWAIASRTSSLSGSDCLRAQSPKGNCH
jgi:hypothetical protein